MQTPHIKITETHWLKAVQSFTGGHTYMDACNKAIEIAVAEQATEQYITAEEARKLGAGNAEWFSDFRKVWEICDADSFDPGYQYRAIKQPESVEPFKQVSWKDVPVGVAVRDKKTNVIWLHQGVGDDAQTLVTAPQNMPFGMRWIDLGDIELAPASEQPWIVVQDDRSIIGLCRELDKAGLAHKFDAMRYRITGIAEGWVLK